jgi:hypothetical protein
LCRISHRILFKDTVQHSLVRNITVTDLRIVTGSLYGHSVQHFFRLDISL